jgi:prepilin-type N-terminal cleavage/methylation domain-containing protein
MVKRPMAFGIMIRARANGWTLTEILIAVAVIGFIASIAIPIALRARQPHTPDGSPMRAVRAVPQDYNGSRQQPSPIGPPVTPGANSLVRLAGREMTISQP